MFICKSSPRFYAADYAAALDTEDIFNNSSSLVKSKFRGVFCAEGTGFLVLPKTVSCPGPGDRLSWSDLHLLLEQLAQMEGLEGADLCISGPGGELSCPGKSVVPQAMVKYTNRQRERREVETGRRCQLVRISLVKRLCYDQRRTLIFFAL